ncbi:MAG TPA: MarR family transcriptional regulator [Sphingobium sp.]|nr:MarR family transcriptional regulator [Sphingobium sp.]
MTIATSGLPPFRQSLAARLIRAREAVIGPLRPALKKVELSEPQWRVLRELAECNSCDPTTLAAAALLHPPSVTRIVRDLEARGLVIRREDGKDRRRAHVSLAPAGRAMAEAVSKEMAGVYEHFSGRFGPDRLARLADELDALATALDEET